MKMTKNIKRTTACLCAVLLTGSAIIQPTDARAAAKTSMKSKITVKAGNTARIQLKNNKKK
ncbi:hypothetical protein [Jutongia sp.]